MRGFFHKSQLLSMGGKPKNLAPRCEICRLYQTCNSPKMPPTGEGKRGVLILAEAPGAKEDERNVQLVGKAGRKLRSVLKNINIDLDEDCWKTNSLICRPPGNKTPTDEQLECCRPNLDDAIEQYQPHTIITLGEAGLKQLINPWWKKELGALGRWVGFQMPLQPMNVWVCPTWHPSYIERENNDVLTLWFQKHLEAAFTKHSRPWKQVPNYNSLVQRTDDARNVLREMADYDGMAAVDYETNMLKPDGNKSSIVSCAITWGKTKAERCVAYPMTPTNRKVTGDFLRSPIPKIAANLKFEERWTLRHFDTRVRNWFWDTMQCAHVLDSRQGITSLDFQAFARLGLPMYSAHISPLLGSKDSVSVNKILTDISLPELLLYNGLDTVAEFELAVVQMKELKQKPPWIK